MYLHSCYLLKGNKKIQEIITMQSAEIKSSTYKNLGKTLIL